MARARIARQSTAMKWRLLMGSCCVIGGLALAGLACHAAAPAKVRELTYPPGFRYYERAEIRTTMGRIARHVVSLHALLGPKAVRLAPNSQPARRSAELADDLREQVVRTLGALESEVASLDADESTTNHPRFVSRLASFRRHVEAARQSAGRSPPNYFLAGAVVGRCLHCHAPEQRARKSR